LKKFVFAICMFLSAFAFLPHAGARVKSSYAILTGSCNQFSIPSYQVPGEFFFLNGGVSCTPLQSPGSIVQKDFSVPIPSPGTLSNLVVQYGSGGGYTVVVWVNAVATSLGCTVSGVTGVCSDTTHDVDVSAGDVMVFVVTPNVTSGSVATGYVSASLEKQ